MAVRESLHQEHGAEMVECVRHEGGKALLGLKNERGGDAAMYCMTCHPDHMGGFGAVAVFERMGA